VAELTTDQFRRAVDDLLKHESLPEPIEGSIAESKAELSPHCREAQNTLRAAIESAGSALWVGAVINRMLKVSAGKQVKGIWATPAQDSLRAAVLFAGAGLDRALKRLAQDTLPHLIVFDQEVNAKLKVFAERSITQGGSVDPRQLVAILLQEGTSPRDIMVKSWSTALASSSAQSADRVEELVAALGVTTKDLRRRVAPTKNRSSDLEKAFIARNEIAHELDVTQPAAETRQKLERIRQGRSATDMRGHVVEMLRITQWIINDVASRLAANG
jgi:hypothetical protein